MLKRELYVLLAFQMGLSVDVDLDCYEHEKGDLVEEEAPLQKFSHTPGPRPHLHSSCKIQFETLHSMKGAEKAKW